MWASAAALLLPSDRGGDRNEAGWRRGWRAGRHCSRQTALLRPHCSRAAHPSGHAHPQQAAGHRVSRPRGTGSVGDSVGEGACLCRERGASCLLLALCASLTQDRFPLPPPPRPSEVQPCCRQARAGRAQHDCRACCWSSAGHLAAACCVRPADAEALCRRLGGLAVVALRGRVRDGRGSTKSRGATFPR